MNFLLFCNLRRSLKKKGWRLPRTVSQIQKFLGGGNIGGDRHIGLLRFSDLKEPPYEGIGMFLRADAVGLSRCGRHGSSGGGAIAG